MEVKETFIDENDEIIEIEEDYDESLKLESFQDTSTFNLDLNVDMIANYYEKGKFVLDPDFQRRNVWDETRKSKFVESMILNLPIPSILIAQDISKNQFIVIDGKQRISAILDFVKPENDGNGFKLKGLEILSELNGYNYKKLINDESKITYLSSFQSFNLKTSVVRNYNEKLLYFIFARLNSGSVPLSTQELRHTLYPGEFSKFINSESSKNNNLKKVLRLKSDKLDARMKDAELLCRFYSFKYFLDKYEDTMGNLFDKTYEILNQKWCEYSEKIIKDLAEFDNSINFIYKVFGDDAFKMYDSSKKVYLKFNRLVFDILAVKFSEPDSRTKVENRMGEFVQFFKEMFNIEEFNNAFKPTTSTKEKTLNRFNIFNREFNNKF